MNIPDKPLTASDVKKLTMRPRFVGEFRGGGCVWSFECAEYPCLEKMVYLERHGKPTHTVYGVANKEIEPKASAIAKALNEYFFVMKYEAKPD